jgi:S1-C subfamily serine protease
MADDVDWSFPESLQPVREGLGFDLERAMDAVVAIRAEVPEDAFTAGTLGTDRGGNGVVIDAAGVVLTIGYLVTEASRVWITTRAGAVVPGYVLGYDQPTGFGLVRALGPLGVPALARGRAAGRSVGDRVYLLSHGGRRHALKARIRARREFAGYWEYLVDEAIFTAPAHPEWSGAALLDDAGQLIGIGSLLTEEQADGEGSGQAKQANMSVPIDLLEPILENLQTTGASGLPARPWLGLYAGQSEGRLVVGGVVSGGPADRAGVRPGDMVIEVAGRRVDALAQFLRTVWSLGAAGVEVPLLLARDGDLLTVRVASVDRAALLHRPALH